MNANVVVKKQIGDLLERITKGTTPNKKLGGFTDEGVNYVKSDAVTYDGRIDVSKFAFISEETHAALKRSQLREDDILFSMAGVYLGKNAIVPASILPANTNQALAILTVDQKLASPHYISYFFRQPQIIDFVNNISGQSAQPNINFEEIKSIGISLPPLRKQSAIAGVLSSLDDKIDLLHRQNKTLEALAETLFRQWFIEDARDDWEEGTLDDVLSVKGGTTPSSKNDDYWNGNIHWTTPRDLSNNDGLYLLDTARKITEAGLAKIGSGLLPRGTLLMSSRAPVGYLAFADVPLAINQGYIAIIDDKGFSKYFIYLWLKTNMDSVKSYANGSTFQEISKTSFKTLDLIIPPKELRVSFDAEITSLFQKMRSNTLQIQTLEKLRDTLLPKLMSGEVRVEV